MNDTVFDVVVVGAGVVGTAIARLLSHHDVSCALVEAGRDVGAGTSKANTAILHTGFDAAPGTLEASLVPRGAALLRAYAREAGIAIEPLGALLVAWDEQQLARLPQLADKAAANGYQRCELVTPDALSRLEPHLGPGALGALSVPDEAIVCPFTPPLAFATEAVRNGVTLLRDRPVLGIEPHAGDDLVVRTAGKRIRCRRLVNAAGLRSDEVDRMLGHTSFTVTPRRGELIVFDKLARDLVAHILLPVPTATTKGVLVSPTVFGNVVLGPTAEDLDDKSDTSSSAAGIATLLVQGQRILPDLVDEEVTAVYAGLRAATEHADYCIARHDETRSVTVGGIRSTGLTASMAIAEHVVRLLAEGGLDLRPNEGAATVSMPHLGESMLRPYADADRIAADPSYGRIICHCERVTEGELRDAFASPIAPVDLDGLRRRTRAQMGRCQGFHCGAEISARFADGLR